MAGNDDPPNDPLGITVPEDRHGTVKVNRYIVLTRVGLVLRPLTLVYD
jgi:hypothetical protein